MTKQGPVPESTFLDNPISMTLPGQSGQEIKLQYENGEWTLQSVEATKEMRRLQKENDTLKQQNAELEAQLRKAMRLAATLQLDLQKLTSTQNIKFANESQRREFTETSAEELIRKRMTEK